MTNETKQELLYIIIQNLLKEIDNLLIKQGQPAVDMIGMLNKHKEVFSEFEINQLSEYLNNFEYKYLTVRQLVNSVNNTLKLLGLPEFDVGWVVVLDENDKTVDK